MKQQQLNASVDDQPISAPGSVASRVPSKYTAATSQQDAVDAYFADQEASLKREYGIQQPENRELEIADLQRATPDREFREPY